MTVPSHSISRFTARFAAPFTARFRIASVRLGVVVTPGLAVIIAVLAAAPACAQTDPSTLPPGTDLFGRIGRWFTMDWSTGWDTGSNARLMSSPYTYHYSHDPDHRDVVMIGLERQRSDGFLLGGTVFRNSFGQPSAYLFAGQRFDHLIDIGPLFAEVTGGLLYGYREPYNHKVPLNYKGFSPGLVPSVGWQLTPVLSAQVNLLGNSALMFQFTAELK